MVTDLKPVTRRFTDLPDDELRATLRRLCPGLTWTPADRQGASAGGGAGGLKRHRRRYWVSFT